MKQKGKYLLFSREEFSNWLFKSLFKRKIVLIQNHHTASPDYDDFHDNHFALLEAMEDYHVRDRGFSDIAQHLTIFPDGLVAVCRSFELDPAGIMGANTGAICIENLGNFDKRAMAEKQKQSIIYANAVLCRRFSIPADTDHIVYHHWYDLNTGKRTNGSGMVKSCPGAGFFGGNTVDAARKYFIPLIKESMKEGIGMSFEEALEIIHCKAGIDKEYWNKRKGIDPNFEKLMIKIANVMEEDAK